MLDIKKLYKEACAQDEANEEELQNEQRKREKRVAWRQTFTGDWMLFCVLIEACVFLMRHFSWYLVTGPLLLIVVGVIAQGLRTNFMEDAPSLKRLDSEDYWLSEKNSGYKRCYFLHDYTPRVLCYWIWRIGKYGIGLQKKSNTNINPDDPDVIMTVINYLEKKVDTEENSIRNQIRGEIRLSQESIGDLDTLIGELEKSLGREPDPKSLNLEELTLIDARNYRSKIVEYKKEQSSNLEKCGEITTPLREEIQNKRREFTLRNRLHTMTKSMRFIESSEQRLDAVNKNMEQLYRLTEDVRKSLNEIGVNAGAKAKTMRECGITVGIS